jgi:D-glycero-alpha-D-manno-heptose 1-phosphate guanylyltransferase
MEAVVLAGGLGTRLRAAVADVPKPLAPVGGRPFLERLLDYWIAQGVRRAVLAIGYMHELIEKHFGTSYRDCEIVYSVEDRPLGTGGALVKSLEFLTERNFLVLNGDTYFAVPLKTLAAFHVEKHAQVTMCLHRSRDPRYTGVTLDKNGRVTSLAGGSLANGGVFLFEREALAGVAPPGFNLERDILTRIEKMYGCAFDAPFVDIGVPEDWRAAEAIIGGN